MNGVNLPDVRPALWQVLARPTRRAVVTDALIWAALAVPVAAGMVSHDIDGGWWTQAAGLVLLGAALAVGRAWPLVPMPIAVVLLLVHGNFAFALPVTAYLTGLRTIRARPVLWAFTAVFVGGTTLNIIRGIDITSWFPLTIWLVLLGVLPWLIGRYWRQYQELLHAGWERADRLEREQRIVAERERLRERARIAQDMHDSLGHELALIAVRAGALQVAPGLDERHRAAAAELRGGAAEATEHLRAIIGVLREGTAAGTGLDAGPGHPAGHGIADLVERAHASGIPVRLEGDPAPETAHGPGQAPMVAAAAYRVVQEALTNAAKHAPGAPVTVRVDRGGDALVVTVANQAPAAGPPLLPAAGAPGGLGLEGLAERVRLAGGTLATGPAPGGGFQVTARLPATDPDRGFAPAAPPPAPDAQAPSESARRLASERRQVRRGLVTAIAVPAALVSVLSAVMLGYYVYSTMNSVLPPSAYAALQPGQDRASVERRLPPMQLINSESRYADHPEPPGTSCLYYRPDRNVLGLSRIYRLCFAGDRLARKDVLRPADAVADGTDGTEPGGRTDGTDAP
ncbi:sensor histidine kinase [Actinomadura sp. 9N407]|uniref:sensor histidine kinase n=1 Tax=Actinomadura sp. 9N407 TaxID=3375154 RepID=UPI0037BB858F